MTKIYLMVGTKRKKWLLPKYSFMVLVQQDEKWKLVLLKYNMMLQTKMKLEKGVTTKI